MLNRENVSAMINHLLANLNFYLNQNAHQILDQAAINKGFNTIEFMYGKAFHKHHTYIALQYKDGLYLVLQNESPARNTMLTLERMKNIYVIRDEINAFLSSLNDTQDNISLNKIIYDMRELLIKAKEENARLSNKYGYIHRSYSESRLIGLGIFSSWWQKSWTQSRANAALEKSLSSLNEFTRKMMPAEELPPAYAPQALSS